MTVFDDLGIPVLHSKLIPEGVLYLMTTPEHTLSPMIWEEMPTEPRWEAVQIVQDGLADVVSWLRSKGHDIPSWQTQRNRAEGRAIFGWALSSRVEIPVFNPNPRTVAIITDVVP